MYFPFTFLTFNENVSNGKATNSCMHIVLLTSSGELSSEVASGRSVTGDVLPSISFQQMKNIQNAPIWKEFSCLQQSAIHIHVYVGYNVARSH